MENQLATLILAATGAVVQWAFKKFPMFSTWYQRQTKNGLWAVLFVFLVSLGYFGLACTPLAANLGINLACTVGGAVELGYAFVIILISQQTTYVIFGSK